MKQENLDELKNIYLGLVTGGEGPEVLSEAPKVTVVDPNTPAFIATPRMVPANAPPPAQYLYLLSTMYCGLLGR